MIAEAALKIAGDQVGSEACLVAGTSGVLHVYAGPLTPAGFVPRNARPVCSANTRRLRVHHSLERRTSLDARAATDPRLCTRCTARLDRDRDRSRRATTFPTSRQEWIAVHTVPTETTMGDVAFALELATTTAEVDAAAWLSLLLFTVGGCNRRFTERGHDWPSLHDLVCRARSRVDGYPPDMRRRAEAHNEQSAAAADQRRREARAVHQEREQRIHRLGINNADPNPPRRRPSS